MSERVWHHGWSGMKGAFNRHREWMTWAELDSLLRILGIRLSWHKVREILGEDQPAKSQGGKRYEKRHLTKVVEWAKAEGLTMTDQQRREAIDAQDEAIHGIRRVCDTYQAGGTTFRLAKQAIEELMDQPSRIVRVGSQTHTPEVQS
jgi:hypothetical protein